MFIYIAIFLKYLIFYFIKPFYLSIFLNTFIPLFYF